MFLKNYTTDVPVHRTIAEIDRVLMRCGVTGILKEFGPNETVTSITFKITGPTGPVTIRLPADEERATEALWRDYAGKEISKDGKTCWDARKRKKRVDFAVQGQRVAWRIVKDWVEIQLSMVELGQAEFLQVFLPYVYDGKRTFFAAMKDGGYAGLLTNAE